MAHFARIDKNNIVQSVHVVDNEHLINEHGNEEEAFGIVYLNKVHGVGFTWIQTSYNAKGGVHYGDVSGSYAPDGGVALRKNYAGIGYTYNSGSDAFIAPQPEPSASIVNGVSNSTPYILNEDTCRWEVSGSN